MIVYARLLAVYVNT